MTDIALRRELLARGLSSKDLARMRRSGELTRVRRGAYAETPASPGNATATHRALLAATLPQVSPEAVVSHASAALLHGLPVWNDQLALVQLTRNRSGGGKTRPYIRLHARTLGSDEIVLKDRIALTSLARTVLDLSCELNLERSVAVGDAALRMGMASQDLASALDAAGRRVGIGRARQAAALLDARSESPEESRSRVIFHLHGLPKPEPQWEVHDHTGRLVARTDFGWEDLMTVGEFDGKVKYGRLLRPGQDPGDVVFKEKQREDELRDLGLQVVRWVSAELWQPAPLLARLERAFERGRRHSRTR